MIFAAGPDVVRFLYPNDPAERKQRCKDNLGRSWTHRLLEMVRCRRCMDAKDVSLIHADFLAGKETFMSR
jgi:hypothetical protein